MNQPTPKNRKINNQLLVLFIFFGSLIFDWSRDLYTNGWSLKPLFNITAVLLFLIASYLVERKTSLSPTARGLFYFLYFLIIGTVASAIIYSNQLNGQMLFLYLFFSFMGTLIWLFVLKKIKSKKITCNTH